MLSRVLCKEKNVQQIESAREKLDKSRKKEDRNQRTGNTKQIVVPTVQEDKKLKLKTLTNVINAAHRQMLSIAKSFSVAIVKVWPVSTM